MFNNDESYIISIESKTDENKQWHIHIWDNFQHINKIAILSQLEKLNNRIRKTY